MKRQEKVQQIFLIAKLKKLNISTLVFVLALSNDKAISKMYNDLKEKYKISEILTNECLEVKKK